MQTTETIRSAPEQSSLYDALAQAAEGAFVTDAEGRIVLWNRAAERLLGYAAGEALGRTCCELLEGRPTEGTGTCRRDRRVRAVVSRGHAVGNFDLRARTKTGQPIWLNVSTLALRRQPGDGLLTIHLVRDATRERDRLVTEAAEVSAAGNGEADSPGPLTPREREVLKLLAAGADTRCAAERLGVSPATIRNHVQNMLGKLGVHSRLQAVAYASARGLL